MTVTKQKSLSPLVQAAAALEQEFQTFERLAGELGRVNYESEAGFERALSLRAELSRTRERLTPASHELSLAMEAAGQRLAAAAELVAQRDEAIAARQLAQDELLQRYRRLAAMVQQITEAVASLRQQGSVGRESRVLAPHLPEISDKLGVLIGESKLLTDAARVAKLKTLERNADSLRQSLQGTRHRFSLLAQEAHA